jgi:hypothetical protein
MTTNKQPKNKSVVNIAEIAREYGYKMEVVYVNAQRAFLSISDNFLRSPYPRHLTSVVRSAEYVERICDKYSF